MNLRKAADTARRLLTKYDVTEPPVLVDDIAIDEGLQVVYHELEDDVSGLLVREDDAAIIAVNVKHHANRQRFTIAHELGHYMLHREEPAVFVDDLLVHFRSDRAAHEFDPRESEANHFAASLLLPRAFLRDDLHDTPVDISDDRQVRALARKYQVSAQALTIRLVSLNLIRAWG
jgi:Zn-dependent peptidase ImmA (M78 family)